MELDPSHRCIRPVGGTKTSTYDDCKRVVCKHTLAVGELCSLEDILVWVTGLLAKYVCDSSYIGHRLLHILCKNKNPCRCCCNFTRYHTILHWLQIPWPHREALQCAKHKCASPANHPCHWYRRPNWMLSDQETQSHRPQFAQ